MNFLLNNKKVKDYFFPVLIINILFIVFLSSFNISFALDSSENSYNNLSSRNNPTVSIMPGESIQQRYMMRDGEVQAIFVFYSQFPKFIGTTNIKNSLISIDINGTTHISGKVNSREDGQWSWQPAVAVKPGPHIVSVTARDSESGAVFAKDSLEFEIVIDKDQIVQKPKAGNMLQIGNGGTLFDIQAVVSGQSKTIAAGDEVVSSIKLVNFGSSGTPIDVEVRYVISNESGKIISEASETIAVSTKTSFLKTFYTSSALVPGLYTLTASIPSKDLIATASDIFEIHAVKASTIADVQENKNNEPNNSVRVLTFLLFAIVIVGYIQYQRLVNLVYSFKNRKASKK